MAQFMLPRKLRHMELPMKNIDEDQETAKVVEKTEWVWNNEEKEK